MPETSLYLPDVIAEIFRENKKTFMPIKTAVLHMPVKVRRDAGIFGLTNAAEIQKIITPMLDGKYVFHRRGTFIFILEPKAHEEFVLDALEKKPQTPKNIARFTPFSKKECSDIISGLVNQGRVILKIDDDLQARIYKTDAPKTPRQASSPARSDKPEVKGNKDYSEYTVENFRKAFHSLDNGRVFVKISDLRKTLGWPRNIFDSALRQLRDARLIQLHAGDASLMTPEEVQDCFVDENNFRMGTVTWHGR